MLRFAFERLLDIVGKEEIALLPVFSPFLTIFTKAFTVKIFKTLYYEVRDNKQNIGLIYTEFCRQQRNCGLGYGNCQMVGKKRKVTKGERAD